MYDNPEKFLAITFFTCAITYFFCLFIVFFVNLFGIVDHALKNKHSIHNRSTPRFGGIAIIVAILFTELIFGSIFKPWFFFAFLPIFIVGVMEDFNYQTKPAVRLLIGSVSSIMAIYLSNTWITSVDLSIIDYVLNFPAIGVLFTIFASVGIINAINLIDGIHGLCSAVTVVISISIYIVSVQVGENRIGSMAALVAAASLGLFFFSYPKGKIFMGDAGAYTLGFLMAWQIILLLERHPNLSAWSFLAITLWPVIDTLFSIYRRLISGKGTNRPDMLHFHHLIMRACEIFSKKRISRNISNPLATIIILPLITLPAILGIQYSQDVLVGIAIVIVASFLYISSYFMIIKLLKTSRYRNFISSSIENFILKYV